MNPTTVFCLFSIVLLAKFTLSVLVSDLKTDVNCLSLLAQKADERAKDPSVVSKKTIKLASKKTVKI